MPPDLFPAPAQPVIVPAIGDIHYSWTGTEWIPCQVTRLTPKGFYCYNTELRYGNHLAKPNTDFRPKPEHPKPQTF